MQDQFQVLQNKIKNLEEQLAIMADAQKEKDSLEEEYRSSQKRFKTIFDESVIGNKIIDDTLKIIKINGALLNMLGYEEHEMLGKQITAFSHPDYREHWKDLQHSIWTTSMASFCFDTCLLKNDGSTLWVHITTILIEDGGENLGYTIIEDISERKELERLKEIVNEQKQRQQIAETILETQETERRRISESLHNGLGQMLYGILLSFKQIKTVPETDVPGNDVAKNYTLKLINDCIKECRKISHNLVPTVLEHSGLKEAITKICTELSGDVKFICYLNLSPKRLNNILEVAIYRIIQELMLNVVKHAQAQFAKVVLNIEDTTIQIAVEDNGKGYRENDSGKVGIGLQMIRSNIALLSGTMSISAPDNNGTKVNILIPKRVD
ncbi:PAS domain-containing sensor histidine kinase [Pedobacter sp. N23S346]|uniref:PAS domain-containing sensor histidine kinase n=1 Tax=Pedobacter sp. N23S346 TaxID=3402750 RepID=UPI003AC57FB2